MFYCIDCIISIFFLYSETGEKNFKHLLPIEFQKEVEKELNVGLNAMQLKTSFEFEVVHMFSIS